MDINLCKICEAKLTDDIELEEGACERCHLLKAQMLAFHQNGQTREEAWDSTYGSNIALPYRVGVKFWDYTWSTRTIELEDTEGTKIFKLLDKKTVVTISKHIAERRKVWAIKELREVTGMRLKPAWEIINAFLPSSCVGDDQAKEGAKKFKKAWVRANAKWE